MSMKNRSRQDLARRTCAQQRRAVAATELAILLPLLTLLCVVSVDCGRFAYSYIALSNAARIGAEYGATQTMTSYNQSSWQAAVKNAVIQEMAATPNFHGGSLSIEISTTTVSYGLQQVTVSAEYPFTPILSWPGMPGAVSMRQTLCMRQFR
jgi:Flp pilus assembly protein TadG